MSDQEKIPYLKIDRGRYFYQRRVPLRMQAHLGIRRWQIPCGDVGYSKAVQMVVTWAEEHDELIADLRSPDRLREAGVVAEKALYADLLHENVEQGMIVATSDLRPWCCQRCCDQELSHY